MFFFKLENNSKAVLFFKAILKYVLLSLGPRSAGGRLYCRGGVEAPGRQEGPQEAPHHPDLRPEEAVHELLQRVPQTLQKSELWHHLALNRM